MSLRVILKLSSSYERSDLEIFSFKISFAELLSRGYREVSYAFEFLHHLPRLSRYKFTANHIQKIDLIMSSLRITPCGHEGTSFSSLEMTFSSDTNSNVWLCLSKIRDSIRWLKKVFCVSNPLGLAFF